MRSKVFIGLVAMMILSIAGISWVQFTWMRNAIRTTNESFNNAVFMSLNNAAGEIESYHRMSLYNNFPNNNPFSFRSDTSLPLTEFFSMGSFFSGNSGTLSYNYSRQSADGKNITRSGVINLDTLNRQGMRDEDSLLVVASGDSPGEVKIVKRKDMNGNNSKSVVMTQSDFISWIRKRSDELRNMSDRMIREIFESEVNYRPDPGLIKNILKSTFPFFGINTPFEFAVIENDEPLYVSSEKINRSDYLKSIYKVRLFDENLLRQGIILSVVFPSRTNYVLGSISWMLIGSSLFSLFILSTFALSIFFILRQKKISEVKSDFINNMTHEFKTPIATISLAADTITNPRVIKDEKSIRHFAGMIKKENERMNKQVETILQLASLDKKEIEFSFGDVSVHTIIRKSIDTVDLLIQQKHGTIITDLKADPDTVWGDEEHLGNLVHNLLDNAIKYSPEKPEIKVSTRNQENGILLMVEDKGIGMSKSVQAKIFERFYRQTSGNVHNVKGFGLGLNYVRSIVEAHRGNISVDSEPGKGSCFKVFLPYKFIN